MCNGCVKKVLFPGNIQYDIYCILGGEKKG